VDNQEQSSPDGVNNPDALIHLADHLRKVPGVRVVGQGDDAQITIQGIKTFEGSTEPLYIVDGQQFNGEFSELAQLVNSVQIKSIQVLKIPSEIARYGV
jgi:outer membrane receptor for ferrienterochelin and colicin